MPVSFKSFASGEPATVAQITMLYPSAPRVFSKYGIDICCGGNRTWEEVCRILGVDAENVFAEILAGPSADNGLHPEYWTSAFLIDFIVQNHHNYVRRSTAEILALLDRVCDVHGADLVNVLTIREHFRDLCKELTPHMNAEEQVLFPAIRSFILAGGNDDRTRCVIADTLRIMEHEHEIAGDWLKQIRALSQNYTIPPGACDCFALAWQKLKEFDNDLMNHVHLENNILFQRFKQGALPAI